MRRKAASPHLLEERRRVRTACTPAVADRIARGDAPVAAWRVESCVTIRRLSYLTGITSARLIAIETSRVEPTREELQAIATGLRVAPELLGVA